MSAAFPNIEEVLNRFARLEAAANNLDEPTKKAGEYMLGSIAKNFDAEGRPGWKPLAESTLENKTGGRILEESGALKNSVTDQDALDAGDAGFDIESNLIYAARQQFGFLGSGGRGHSETPARPFLLFQDEDDDSILEIFNRPFEML